MSWGTGRSDPLNIRPMGGWRKRKRGQKLSCISQSTRSHERSSMTQVLALKTMLRCRHLWPPGSSTWILSAATWSRNGMLLSMKGASSSVGIRVEPVDGWAGRLEGSLEMEGGVACRK